MKTEAKKITMRLFTEIGLLQGNRRQVRRSYYVNDGPSQLGKKKKSLEPCAGSEKKILQLFRLVASI